MAGEISMNYIILVVAIVVIVAAVILVRRTRLRSDDGKLGASRILDIGWQFYFTPTTMEPPGSVFRLDAKNRRYKVQTLRVKTQSGEEAFGVFKESVVSSLDILGRFFKLASAGINASSTKTEKIVFAMDNVTHDVLGDEDLNKVLQPFLEKLEYRVDNRYFVIRECRLATDITCYLTKEQVDNFGGKVTLSDSIASLNGTLFKSGRSGEFLLQKKFDKPMQIMYLPEEIKPITAGLAGMQPQLGLVPVKEVLVCEDASDDDTI